MVALVLPLISLALRPLKSVGPGIQRCRGFNGVLSLGRREAVAALAAASLSGSPAFARTSFELSGEEKDVLDLASRTAAGYTLPSGIRVIDVNRADGDAHVPAKGDRVYAHFKVWTLGFRSGPPVDSSFFNSKPYDWFLGSPDERIRAGFDEGAQGMRTGDWRRLVVPARLAYGELGLTRGRGVVLVQPAEDVYVDLLMLDAEACDVVLRPDIPKVGRAAFGHDTTLKSTLCKGKKANP